MSDWFDKNILRIPLSDKDSQCQVVVWELNLLDLLDNWFSINRKTDPLGIIKEFLTTDTGKWIKQHASDITFSTHYDVATAASQGVLCVGLSERDAALYCLKFNTNARVLRKQS